jgi:hypothetical protein
MTYGRSILEDLRLAEEAGMVFPEAEVVLEEEVTAENDGLEELTISLDWPLIQFGFIGHCGTSRGSFCVFGPVLSSPAHGAASLAMALRRIEVVFVLRDDLKLTSGLRTPTAFNGQNYVFKIAGSNVLDEYYNSYLKE